MTTQVLALPVLKSVFRKYHTYNHPLVNKTQGKRQEEYLCFVFLTGAKVKCSTMHSHQFLKRMSKAEVIVQRDVL